MAKRDQSTCCRVGSVWKNERASASARVSARVPRAGTLTARDGICEELLLATAPVGTLAGPRSIRCGNFCNTPGVKSRSAALSYSMMSGVDRGADIGLSGGARPRRTDNAVAEWRQQRMYLLMGQSLCDARRTNCPPSRYQ